MKQKTLATPLPGAVPALDGQRVAGHVEDPLIEWEQLVAGEDQVEVLEGGADEVAGLVVPLDDRLVVDAVDLRVAAVVVATVLVDGLRQLPGVVPVALVAGEAVQDKVALEDVRHEKVVAVAGEHRRGLRRRRVDEEDGGCQTEAAAIGRQVTRFGDLPGQTAVGGDLR